MCCSVSQSVLQCDTATHCNTLQHTATHCNKLCDVHHHSFCSNVVECVWHDSATATHCNTLQHTATHCNTLQHTATHCNTSSCHAWHWEHTIHVMACLWHVQCHLFYTMYMLWIIVYECVWHDSGTHHHVTRDIKNTQYMWWNICNIYCHSFCTMYRGEVGGWGRVPFSRNLMKPTPRRKWYLTTGRRFH